MRTIQITKEQYDALDHLLDDRLKFGQFIVDSKLNRGEAYKTADGRTLYKTYETYFLTVVNENIDYQAIITENPNHRFAKIHAIVPLFTIEDEETPAEADGQNYIEEVEVPQYNAETDETEIVTTYRVTVNGETDVRYFLDRADAEKLLASATNSIQRGNPDAMPNLYEF
jgi:hypothetical protein